MIIQYKFKVNQNRSVVGKDQVLRGAYKNEI